MLYKTCKGCGNELGLDAFSRPTSAKHPRNVCKECENRRARERAAADPEKTKLIRRKTLLKTRYGLTIDDYEAMLEQQDHSCAICGSIESRTGISDRLVVDHSHETGAVRGLLCSTCNAGLGAFQDDPLLLLSAVSYLREHGD